MSDLYIRPEQPAAGVGSGYTSPASRARVARWFIGLVVAADGVSLVVLAAQRALLDRGAGQITLSEWHRSEAREGGAELLGLSLLVVAAIFFLRWLHLCYRNTRELHRGTRFSPGWAVGYWFVPIANLWRPKQVVDELWSATEDLKSSGRKGSRLVLAWWLLFLASNLAYRTGAFGSAETLDDLKRRNVLFSSSHVLSLAAGICLFVLVGKLTRRQDEAAERANPG